MADRSRHPWDADEVNILADGARDGLTIKSLARTLNRSPYAVTAQLRKIGIRTLRHNTREMTLALKLDAIDKLAAFARARSMTVNTFARYVLEVLADDKAEFLRALIDEDAISARHDALELVEDPRPRSQPSSGAGAISAPGPDVMAEVPARLLADLDNYPQFTVSLGGVQLAGRVS
jgi:hypothetical protein